MIGIIYGNNRATKSIISKESGVQIKENMLLLVECVCPYHKRKRR
jgi:hypothetical protein